MSIEVFDIISGAPLILGAICLNGIPFSMLMRHPSYLTKTDDRLSICVESAEGEDCRGVPPSDVSNHCHQVSPSQASHSAHSPAADNEKKSHCRQFANQIGLHLLKDWKFTVFWISTSLTYLSHVTLHWFIPDRAIEIGFSPRDAAMTIVVVNIANMFSRLVFGFTSSDKFINHIILLVIYVFLSGLSSILVLIWTSYWSYMFFSGLFGILRGLYVIYQLLMIVDLAGKENVSLGLGLIYSLAGLVFLVSIPRFGYFNEVTNSYVTTFMLYGGLEILRGLLLLPILIHSCLTKIKQNKRLVKMYIFLLLYFIHVNASFNTET